jgi:hypothetical protein
LGITIMAVLSCPHCGSVHIVVGGEPESDICTRIDCRGIMGRLYEPEAGATIRKAFYAHDHEISAVTITAEAP